MVAVGGRTDGGRVVETDSEVTEAAVSTHATGFDADQLALALDDPPVADAPGKSRWYLRTCFGTDGPIAGCFKQPAADVPDGSGALETPYRVRVSFRFDAAAGEVPVGKPLRVAAERRWAIDGGFKAPAQGVSQASSSGNGKGKTMRTGLDARTIAARTATRCFANVPFEEGDEAEAQTEVETGVGSVKRENLTQQFVLAGGVEVRVFSSGLGTMDGCVVEVRLRDNGKGGGERCIRREFDINGELRSVCLT